MISAPPSSLFAYFTPFLDFRQTTHSTVPCTYLYLYMKNKQKSNRYSYDKQKNSNLVDLPLCNEKPMYPWYRAHFYVDPVSHKCRGRRISPWDESIEVIEIYKRRNRGKKLLFNLKKFGVIFFWKRSRNWELSPRCVLLLWDVGREKGS